MHRLFALIIFATVSTLYLTGCGGDSPKPTGGGAGTTPAGTPVAAVKKPGQKVIAVIPKSTAHEFWREVGQGAEEAAVGHNIQIIFKAGDPGDRAESQLTLVDQMLAQNVDAIVLAPVDSKKLMQAVDKCFEAKIPLVIIDSGVESDFNQYTAYVATDNKEGGAKCARTLAEAIGKKGSVLLFRYERGSASTDDREAGFEETLKKEFPDVKILQDKYGGPTREDAIKNANELLAANPKFDGVFACNESSSVGMLQALREKGLAGKVKFVGFDTAKILIEAVESGEIVALAAQNPRMIGSEGVTQAINALEKKKIDVHTEIPAEMKTRETYKLEEDLRKQQEAEKKREEENKRIQAEVEAENARRLKEFEAEQAKFKEEMRRQEEDEKKREAEIKRLKDQNDAQNAEKIKEIEEAQKKYKDDLQKNHERDQKHEAELKAMKEDFDRKADEQRKKLEAEKKAHEGK